MSNIDDNTHQFDDLNMPEDEFEPADIEGIQDPNADAAIEEPVEEPAVPGETIEETEDTVEAGPGSGADKSFRGKMAGLLVQASQASPFTVMLAISVLAIGVALLCLILEWHSYGFNREPPKTLTMGGTIQSQRSPLL